MKGGANLRKRITAFILILLISTLVLPSIATAFVADPPASARSSLVNKKVKLFPWRSDRNPIRQDNNNIKISWMNCKVDTMPVLKNIMQDI